MGPIKVVTTKLSYPELPAGILPQNGRLIDQPAAQAAAKAPGEDNRRRLLDDDELK